LLSIERCGNVACGRETRPAIAAPMKPCVLLLRVPIGAFALVMVIVFNLVS
jgi:hypothetical protein